MDHQTPTRQILDAIDTKTVDRRYDLDWLRIVAFGVLVFFHSAVLFLPSGIPNVINDQSSLVLSAGVAFLHQFRLALLFLVSGMGVYFALKKRRGAAYIKERSTRLLIPLLFGILVIVPPMIYLENLYNDRFSGSFVEFYPSFFTQGLYPNGNLSWHHYWFIAYLYIFCLLSWPLFKRWRDQGADQLQRRLSWMQGGYRVYLLIIPLILVEIALRPWFPGFRNLVSDWASFAHWLIIFVAGYAMASNHTVLDKCRDLRYVSLLVAAVSSTFLFALFYNYETASFPFDRDITFPNALKFIAFTTIRMVGVWCWLLVCVGFAGKYLNHKTTAVIYLNRAVYPVFCLHLTTIVAIGFFVLPTSLSIPIKFTIISLGTLALVLFFYQVIIRQIGALGALVGAKNL